MNKDEKARAVLEHMYKISREEGEYMISSTVYDAKENMSGTCLTEEERTVAVQLRLLVIALVEVLG